MRRLMVVGAVAAAVLGGAAIAAGDGGERRVVDATASSRPEARPVAGVNERLALARAARVRCRTLGCINRSLTKLAKAVENLNRETYRCERYVNITAYDGYVYTPDGGATLFETTALDYSQEGDPASGRFLVYVC